MGLQDTQTRLPDTETHRNRRKIRSQTSTREYTLSQRISTGAWECSCPGWTTHRKCRHLPVESDRQHWMCLPCQGIHRIGIPATPRGDLIHDCCWCGGKTRFLIHQVIDPPCQNVHLEDVS